MCRVDVNVANRLEGVGVYYLDGRGETLSTITLCHDLLVLWHNASDKAVKKECKELINMLLEMNE